MARAKPRKDESAPAWRQRAVSKSLSAARSRAEQRVQRLLDAAFALIDEKGSAEFTIQEVVDRSKQSLRGFYQYFDGKDELLFALLEENIREAIEDIGKAVASEAKPLERLRAFTVATLEALERHHLPGWQIPRLFAGHVVAADVRADLCFTLGHLAAAGVTDVGGAPPTRSPRSRWRWSTAPPPTPSSRTGSRRRWRGTARSPGTRSSRGATTRSATSNG